MRASIACVVLCAAVFTAQAAQLYRWVDESGQVHYTDQPPPPKIRDVERKRVHTGRTSDGDMPYALQQAVKKYPITLFTASDCGEGCQKAVAYLNKRGAPYQERDARDPAAAETLMKLNGGKLEVPLATVGSTVLRGYEENAWKTALDAAGYPSSRVMPASAATPKKKPAPPAATAGAPPGDDAASGSQ